MATRITQRYLTDSTLGDLNLQNNQLSTLQQQLATELRINRPTG